MEDLSPDNIMQTIRMMYTASILFLIISHGVFVILSVGVL